MRRTGYRIAVWGVPAPELDGIHPKVMCQFIHRALDRESADRLSGRTHEGVCQHVKIQGVLNDIEAFRCVERSGRQSECLVAGAVWRLYRKAMVKQSFELSVGVGSETDALFGLRPATDQAMHAGPRQGDPHRSTGKLGRGGTQYLVIPQAFSAEASADKRRTNIHLRLFDSEDFGK